MTSTAAPPIRPKSAPVVLRSKLNVRCFKCGKSDKVKEMNCMDRKGVFIRPIYAYRCVRCNYAFTVQKSLSFAEKTAKESDLKESAKVLWGLATVAVGTEVGLHGHEDCDKTYMHALGPATAVASTAVVQEKDHFVKAMRGFDHIATDTVSDIADAGLAAASVLVNLVDGVKSIFTAPSGRRITAARDTILNTGLAVGETEGKVLAIPVKLVGRLFGKAWDLR